MSPVRPKDRWFIDEVLPEEGSYLKLARRLTHSHDDARDLVQEAYARLFAMDGWAAITNPPAYVSRCIRNIAIEKLRRAKVIDFRHMVEADQDEFVDDTPDAFRIMAGREGIRKISEALARLPERCREVFVRRRVHDQSPTEISEALGVSISTLEKRLARAFFLLARDGIGNDPAQANGSDWQSDDKAQGR